MKTRPKRIRFIVATLALVLGGIVGFGSPAISALLDGDHHDGETEGYFGGDLGLYEEPIEAQATGRPVQVAAGTFASGDEWVAIRYSTRRGDICIDVTVTGPTIEAIDGIKQTSGGCFSSDQAGSGQARLGDETVAFGYAPPNNLVIHSSRLDIVFSSGANVTAEIDEQGAFVAFGEGIPIAITEQGVPTSRVAFRQFGTG